MISTKESHVASICANWGVRQGWAFLCLLMDCSLARCTHVLHHEVDVPIKSQLHVDDKVIINAAIVDLCHR